LLNVSKRDNYYAKGFEETFKEIYKLYHYSPKLLIKLKETTQVLDDDLFSKVLKIQLDGWRANAGLY